MKEAATDHHDESTETDGDWPIATGISHLHVQRYMTGYGIPVLRSLHRSLACWYCGVPVPAMLSRLFVSNPGSLLFIRFNDNGVRFQGNELTEFFSKNAVGTDLAGFLVACFLCKDDSNLQNLPKSLPNL